MHEEFIKQLKSITGCKQIEVNNNKQAADEIKLKIHLPTDHSSRKIIDSTLETLLESCSLTLNPYYYSSFTDHSTNYIEYTLPQKDFDQLKNALSESFKKLGTFILSHVANQNAFDKGIYHLGYSEIQILNEANYNLENDGDLSITFSDELLTKYHKYYSKCQTIKDVKGVLAGEINHLLTTFNKNNPSNQIRIYSPIRNPDGLGSCIYISANDVEKLKQLGFAPLSSAVSPTANTKKSWEEQCKWFVKTVEQFKEDNAIYKKKVKSLRRDVFGVSDDEHYQMPNILSLRKKFFSIPGMTEFITLPKLFNKEGQIDLNQIFGYAPQKGSTEEKAKKYLSIIFGGIQHHQLKNPEKYNHTNQLYYANSDRANISYDSYRALTSKHNQGLWKAAKSTDSAKEIEKEMGRLSIKK